MGEDWGKLIIAKGIKKLPKVQNIVQSGHTAPHPYTKILTDEISPLLTRNPFKIWISFYWHWSESRLPEKL